MERLLALALTLGLILGAAAWWSSDAPAENGADAPDAEASDEPRRFSLADLQAPDRDDKREKDEKDDDKDKDDEEREKRGKGRGKKGRG